MLELKLQFLEMVNYDVDCHFQIHFFEDGASLNYVIQLPITLIGFVLF